MDEHWYDPKPTSPTPSAPPSSPEKERLRFAPRDWLAALMALPISALWFSVFGLAVIFNSTAGGMPSLGAAAFTSAVWAAVLIYLGRDARWSRWSLGLAAGVALLTLCCAVYAGTGVKLVNYLLILCGSALCFFSISGAAQSALTEARVIGETAVLTFRALFSNCFKPFRALGTLADGDRRRLGQVGLGLLAALPLLAVVLYLLSSADAVFASLFSGLGRLLGDLDALAVWRFARLVLLALLIFSALYFLRHFPKPAEPRKKRQSAPAAPFVTVLVLLVAVYAVFAAIQFRFLFGGAETAAMEGGYAEYARGGFFQLVRVSAINLAVCLCCGYSERKAVINVMSTILLALTAVILFSAFWRMRLYISAYGLSLLRALTLWAMAFIALCLVLAGLRIWREGFRFWPWFAALGLAGWLLLNAVNIHARVADYNVDAYLDGRLPSVDIYYLSTLSPDVLPALERLREAEGGGYRGDGDSDFYLSCDLDDAINNARERYFAPGHWSQWTLSWARNHR